MSRSTRIQILLVSAIGARVALGQQPKPAGPQNSDLSILIGPVFGGSQAFASTGASVKTSGVFTLQSSFAHTIHGYSFADLWFEFPTTTVRRESDVVGGGTSRIEYSEIFVTPGLRLHIPAGERLSIYGAVGGGYGRFDANQNNADSGHNKTQDTWHGAFDFGGGIDFRLTRLLSLRTDLRDFVTGKGLGGVQGRNHVLVGFGVAAHF